MDKQTFIEHFKTLSLNQQGAIVNELSQIRREHFNATYQVVEVHNYSGNIASKIEKLTDFQSYHVSGSVPGAQGTNKVLVPQELYSPELETALKEFFGAWSREHDADEWQALLERTVINI